MTRSPHTIEADALIVGASLAGAACAKRLVDAGYETIILERKKLPRFKICSGILSPRGHRFLIENFGPLPRSILHEPTACSGVTFYFPSMRSLTMDFDGGPTPHLNRIHSDHWAVQRSGARVDEETVFTGLEDEGDHVTVDTLRRGEPVRYRARFVIGADGRSLQVVRAIYPDYVNQIPWFVVGQRHHAVKSCPLDDDYFHFWFHPKLGHYTWSHARNGKQIVGVGFPKGGKFGVYHNRVVSYLEASHQVELEPTDEQEACVANFGPSLINRYVFGKGRVIITGQAAGFFNMIAEGMSCALHSGAIAGEAVVETFRSSRDVQTVYRDMIASEVRHCTDQWNPLQIAFGRPHEADFRAALSKLPLGDRLGIIGELLDFTRIYAPFKWGRQIIGQSLYRLLHGSYATDRWL